ncbi:hypothetical protein BCR34DRAFT_568770 [Clohesyomyces aquaticus]|uniref:Uncharacterized protein n=1 Tax=Clohesyomyces aquaticus TaxID=1231657 RepID=A0A1Y1ZG42_9PLEO|nr:hypothetical protein BCR34DRAFT_568770 [Clohesyomyces aquaticus]
MPSALLLQHSLMESIAFQNDLQQFVTHVIHPHNGYLKFVKTTTCDGSPLNIILSRDHELNIIRPRSHAWFADTRSMARMTLEHQTGFFSLKNTPHPSRRHQRRRCYKILPISPDLFKGLGEDATDVPKIAGCTRRALTNPNLCPEHALQNAPRTADLSACHFHGWDVRLRDS